MKNTIRNKLGYIPTNYTIVPQDVQFKYKYNLKYGVVDSCLKAKK